MNFKNIIRMILPEKKQVELLKNIVNWLYQLHKKAYFATNINYPKDTQCIFALWHAHQCGLYSLEDREKINIMISRSSDGNIIAHVVEELGFKTVRGSQNRGGANRGGSAVTRELIHRIQQGESGAITIDGPNGPKHIVKKGILDIARITGVPIIPMTFYAGKNGFIKFKTWDEFSYPVPFKKLINIYGEPIFVPEDADSETIEKIRKEIEDKLIELYEYAKNNYKELIKNK